MISVLKNIQSILEFSSTKPLNCLSMGNSKLPKFVGIFNLLAGADCGNSKDCLASCYAIQAQVAYPATYNQRLRNSIMAHKNIDLLYKKLIEEIDKRKPRVIRIHESGDFISNEYVKMWIAIAKYCKELDIPLYTYSKMYGNLEKLNDLNAEPNVNIINSIIKGHRNYGSQEYCKLLHDNFGAFICVDSGHEGKCMVSCRYCLTGDRVCFPIHGNKRYKDNYNEKIQK